MKAIVYHKYGPPEVAKLAEIDKPVPQKNELLIKVYSSTVNRTDSGIRSAEYFISRFWSGLFYPKKQILGSEFAGVVEEIGTSVTSFKIGDKVFGFNEANFGGHAEYLAISESDAVSIIPNNFDFDNAAPLTEGAHYALVNIRAANVKARDNVLVNGSTGAIGSAAVQLLKHFGAIVTAVCNTKNVELVKSLGADFIVDYEKDDFTNTTSKYSFIFDAVGKSSFNACKPLLTENGIYISTELGKNAENIFYALITKFGKGKKLLFPIPTITKEDTNFIKRLAEDGKFKPIIDRKYSMNNIVEAYHYVQSGQKTGNVILKIVE